jgi:hypothetical protein
MQRYDDARPFAMYGICLLRPLQRIDEAPAWAKALAPVGGLLTAILNDAILLQLLALYLFAGVVDFVIGAMIAQRERAYNADRARAGVLGKVSALVLVMLLRALEAVLAQLAPVNSSGLIAGSAALVLFLQELRSINTHRETLTGRPVPLLGALFDRLDRVAESIMQRGTQEDPHP